MIYTHHHDNPTTIFSLLTQSTHHQPFLILHIALKILTFTASSATTIQLPKCIYFVTSCIPKCIYLSKDQNLPNKNIHSNNSSGKPLPSNSNYSRNQSPYNSNYRGRSPEQRHSRNFSQNRYSRSNSQNNQYRNNFSRSNSNKKKFSIPVPIQILGIDNIQTIDHETHHTTEIETIQTIGIEVI